LPQKACKKTELGRFNGVSRNLLEFILADHLLKDLGNFVPSVPKERDVESVEKDLYS
jgi:hypothetical protein